MGLTSVLILILLVSQTTGLTKPTSVKLINNGYTGVVIAIHHDEPESEALINALVATATNASSYLYNATRHRAYFQEVMILIPDTWEDKAEYQSPRNSTFEGADIIVAARNPRYGPDPKLPAEPHTKHYEGCGKRAVHIHLTSEFLLHNQTDTYYGDKGRILVHEWAHYRWGLFDEYPNPLDDLSEEPEQFYYSASREQWEPIRCTRGYDATEIVFDPDLGANGAYRLCGGNPKDGYEEGCVSFPAPTQDLVTASILSGQTKIPQIVDFCDEGDHNDEAENKHNTLCDDRSAWEVMRDHEDFRDDNNSPREVDDVTPTIILAKTRDIRVVLVLDSSGSMQNHNRIDKLASSSQDFIRNIAVTGSYIGIVDFDHLAKNLSGLTLIDSEDKRERLADLIPTTASGGTCIGYGLDLALQILSENGQSPAGGLILLITDGIDGCDETTTLLGQSLVSHSVVVDSVTMSQGADAELIELSRITGGNYYLQTDDVGSTGLHDAFVGTMESGVKEQDRRIEIHRELSYYDFEESRSRGVFIDETVGNRTTFEFSYFVDPSPYGAQIIDVIVISPTETEYNSHYAGYKADQKFRVISVEFETTEPGPWRFRVTNLHGTGLEVFSNVYTYPSRHGVDPIIATSELSGSTTDFANVEPLIAFAEVRQGFYPVIRAKVTAVIERPPDKNRTNYPPVEMELLDNGAGADITEDDGIYSRYFTQFTGTGYYGLSINIESDETTVILDGTAPLPYSRTLAYVDPEELLKGNIPKIDGAPIFLPGMPLPEPRGSPAPNFTRSISGGASQVPETPENWEPGDDIIAPSKIVDMRVVAASWENGTVSLEFTAPGDDLDRGNASYYVIRRAGTPAELRANYTSLPSIDQTQTLVGELDSPGQFGDQELFVVLVSVPEDQPVVSYTFAMHAVDEASNSGDMSNTAQATLRRTPRPTPSQTPGVFPLITTLELTTSKETTIITAPTTDTTLKLTTSKETTMITAPTTNTTLKLTTLEETTMFTAPTTNTTPKSIPETSWAKRVSMIAVGGFVGLLIFAISIFLIRRYACNRCTCRRKRLAGIGKWDHPENGGQLNKSFKNEYC